MTDKSSFKRLTALAEPHYSKIRIDPDDWDQEVAGPQGFLTYIWEGVYEYGTGDKPDPDTIEEITDLWAISPEGGGSVEMAAVMLLADGLWATCVAYADYTGFGSGYSVDWRINATRDAAINYGLDKEARVHLGLGPAE